MFPFDSSSHCFATLTAITHYLSNMHFTPKFPHFSLPKICKNTCLCLCVGRAAALRAFAVQILSLLLHRVQRLCSPDETFLTSVIPYIQG